MDIGWKERALRKIAQEAEKRGYLSYRIRGRDIIEDALYTSDWLPLHNDAYDLTEGEILEALNDLEIYPEDV